MGAYKYKNEDDHQRHLAYRREYYWKNHQRVRARDNESARRNRKSDPERFKKYQRDFRARLAAQPQPQKTVTLETNPDRELIEREMINERSGGPHA